MQPVYSNLLLAQLPTVRNLSFGTEQHEDSTWFWQLDFGNITAFPKLDVNKLSLCDFEVPDWLELT